MQYYAGLSLIVMLGVIVKVYAGQPILWFAVIGFAVSLILGNMMAYVQLKRSIAEIFFLNEHFSIISVYEILFQRNNHVFPLIYANPRKHGDHISIHFNDQIINLYEKDWEEYELIWNWLNGS